MIKIRQLSHSSPNCVRYMLDSIETADSRNRRNLSKKPNRRKTMSHKISFPAMSSLDRVCSHQGPPCHDIKNHTENKACICQCSLRLPYRHHNSASLATDFSDSPSLFEMVADSARAKMRPVTNCTEFGRYADDGPTQDTTRRR